MLRRIAPFAFALALVGCSGLNPQRLDDQVAMFHDDLRWGRLPAATQFVAPRLVSPFLRRHARWVRGMRIMDVETESLEVRGTTGMVRTRYLWTLPDEVEVRESYVETRWRSNDGRWLCDDERVVAGDTTLLGSSDPPAEPTAPTRPSK